MAGSWSDEALGTGGVGTWAMHIRAPFSPVAALAVAMAHLAEAFHRDREAGGFPSAEALERAETAYRIAIERWQRLCANKRVRGHMARFAASRGSTNPERDGVAMMRSVIEDLLASWLLHDVSGAMGRVRWKLVEELREQKWVSEALTPRFIERKVEIAQALRIIDPAVGAYGLAALASEISDPTLRFAIGDEIEAALESQRRNSFDFVLPFLLAAKLAAIALPEHFGVKRQLARLEGLTGYGNQGEISNEDLPLSLDLVAWRLGLPPPFDAHREALATLLPELDDVSDVSDVSAVVQHARRHPQLAAIDANLLTRAIHEAEGPWPTQICLSLAGRLIQPSGIDEAARDRVLWKVPPSRPLRSYRAVVRDWFTTRRDWALKAGAAAAVVLFVVGLHAYQSTGRRNSERLDAYEEVVSAARTGKAEEIHAAARRFLTIVPAGDPDPRLARVTAVFGESLSSEIALAIERDDHARLSRLAEDGRQLQPYLGEVEK